LGVWALCLPLWMPFQMGRIYVLNSTGDVPRCIQQLMTSSSCRRSAPDFCNSSSSCSSQRCLSSAVVF